VFPMLSAREASLMQPLVCPASILRLVLQLTVRLIRSMCLGPEEDEVSDNHQEGRGMGVGESGCKDVSYGFNIKSFYPYRLGMELIDLN
jgi:hypothetical protein